MTTPNFGPFGTYANVTGVVDATAKTEITAILASLKTLIPTQQPDGGAAQNAPAPSPDFDQQRPSQGEKLQAEIDFIDAAVQAAPEA